MPLSRFNPDNYDAELAAKADRVQQLLAAFNVPAPTIYPSAPQGYRMRAEFRLWHDGDALDYAMYRPGEPKTPIVIETFPPAAARIQAAMPILRDALAASPQLRRKIFQVEFLATLSDQLLISLIYHRPLEEDKWIDAAQPLAALLGARIIGRSRKQRLVLSEDFVEEVLTIGDNQFYYRQLEQGFTQPNAGVNIHMVEWACHVAENLGGHLLELYCGNGNFTLPLAGQFERVLATEVAKSSMRAAIHNQSRNGVDNLQLVRLSAQEVSEALAGSRPFRRLQALPVPLEAHHFSTVFVDPPRAGLDPATERLVSGFANIIYISCNPHTLAQNLQGICNSHRIVNLALFDQFPYTDHIECGVFLQRKP
jgi:tRNA (uracil-5-)-methyltransferase